mmetsp:Transcript_11506/g.27141  ORF Transcript_11506/g.27141 Transcript_11506/m.27141 type:complete len:160 (+) Transcript_11506:30-509(+)
MTSLILPSHVENVKADMTASTSTCSTCLCEIEQKWQKRGRQKAQRQRHLAKFMKKQGFQHVDKPPMSCWRNPFEEVKCPIHVAAQNGDYQALRGLLAAGAEPSRRTSKNRTALDLAKSRDRFGSHRKVIELLEADVKIHSMRGALQLMMQQTCFLEVSS